jgi:riboflavin synthase
MFTGLIEDVGVLVERHDMPTGVRLRVETILAPELQPGDSVAVNGVCLTVLTTAARTVDADLGPETLRVTTLGKLRQGSAVNLERPLRMDSRLGGHFVQGHVDGVGHIEARRADGDSHWFTIGFPAALAAYLIPKGSVAVDGISLTVAHLGRRTFDVQIVPFTLGHTNLGKMPVGEAVNLECDLVGKYVVRQTELAERAH